MLRRNNVKYKRIRTTGFGFASDKDMRKLNRLAKQGWILESASKLFFKLKESEPQDLVYLVDYRLNYNSQYFRIFQNAGWDFITTLDNHIHIFSAPRGT